MKTEAAFEILKEKNDLAQALENQRHTLANNAAKNDRLFQERKYLEGLAVEARSESIETRIIIAEFYSFLASDGEKRANWAEFRDHLYETQERLNEERAILKETESNSASTLAEIAVARARLEQILRQENPSSATSSEIRELKRIIIKVVDDAPIEFLRRFSVSSRGWSDIGEHFVIRTDGALDVGRPISKTPAVARGFNSETIAIGVACDLSKTQRKGSACIVSDEQYNELRRLVSGFAIANDISSNEIYDFFELQDQSKHYDFLGDLVSRLRIDLQNDLE